MGDGVLEPQRWKVHEKLSKGTGSGHRGQGMAVRDNTGAMGPQAHNSTKMSRKSGE